MRGGKAWAVGGWAGGVPALIVALPLAAGGRLPDPVATHWGGSGQPDGSMPLWGAIVFPAAVWAVLVLGVVLARRWAASVLLPGGVLLAGAQAVIVRANLDLDRGDWRQAGALNGWLVAAVVGAAALAGTAGVLVDHRRRADAPGAPTGAGAAGVGAAGTSAGAMGAAGAGAAGMGAAGTETPGAKPPGREAPGGEASGVEIPGGAAPGVEAPGVEAPGREAPGAGTPGREAAGMDIPAGERFVWLARTSNPWLRLIAAVTGLAAAGAALAGVGGLVGSAAWGLVAPLGLASLLVLACSSVQARVTGKGLEVAFGPLGWPVRRWAAPDVESARVEDRRPVQVGGWGYRLSGLGTTVMLRGGPCLVVRSKGKDFAVSVDDADRGAALLNSVSAEVRSV
ncbi:DUF1648 domain-containing protein [Streptomyces sp. NPDC048337]|uniref:DUF1648 domain-containing protein n=1 Tax=Streptomyces sp. NPDC048337 TaxID=3365535 RepID=UPI00371364B9